MSKGGLIVTVWKYRRQAYMLSYMDEAPAEGNLCYERKDALMTLNVECYIVLKIVTAIH